MLRICKKCNIKKPLEKFCKSNACKNGYRYECKECKNKRYIKKGPCTDNPSWFKKGHAFIAGAEKGWFKKGQKSLGAAHLKGKKPHNFIDGKSKKRGQENRRFFCGNKAVKIRLQVIERDGHTCKICQIKQEKLHVHHVIPLRVDKTKAYNMDNLITVCPKCHMKIEWKKQ